MMMAGREKERDECESERERVSSGARARASMSTLVLYSRQVPEKDIVTRQVKTCLHLPILSSYHTILFVRFPNMQNKKKPPFVKHLWADFYKEMNSGIGAI